MSHPTAAVLTLILACTTPSGTFVSVARGDDVVNGPLTQQYREAAKRIVTATLEGNDAYNKLEHLCVNIGHRLSGSAGLEKAIDWAVAAMKKDGQQNAHRERVMVPH